MTPAVTPAMSDEQLLRVGTDLLYREAALLDSRQWHAWLDLYVEDCEFWLPAWLDEHRYTADPATELSLIYYRDRHGLEDRIERIASQSSPASMPMPRTWHAIANIRLEGGQASAFHLFSGWQSAVYRPDMREESRFYGFYEHTLGFAGEALKILKKKIILINDHVPAVIDIYSI